MVTSQVRAWVMAALLLIILIAFEVVLGEGTCSHVVSR